MTDFIKQIIDDAIYRQNHDIINLIAEKKRAYEENLFPYTREPFFLVYEDIYENDKKYHWESVQRVRTEMKTPFRIEGCLMDIGKRRNDQLFNGKMKCVAGLFIDNEFLPIMTMESFYYIVNVLKNKENLIKENLKK